MKQYSFIQENLFLDFIHNNSLCNRAYNLRERVSNECIKEIRKLKSLYKQHRINTKTYKKLLAKQHDKMSRLELRLSNMDLI